MNAMRTLMLIMILASSAFLVQAQDQIIRRDGQVIHCKVVKMGTHEITYTLLEYDHSVEFLIDISKVEKVVFKNEKEIIIDHAERARESIEINSADLFLIQKKRTVKLDLLNILLGTTALSYERTFKPGRSYEFELGLIGLGLMDEGLGVGLKAGYKFFIAPDFYVKRLRYDHILKGSYFKPEIAFAGYRYKFDYMVAKGAVMITGGYQTVFSDKFLIDLYYSTGLGITSGKPDDLVYFSTGSYGFSFAESWGIRIGFLF